MNDSPAAAAAKLSGNPPGGMEQTAASLRDLGYPGDLAATAVRGAEAGGSFILEHHAVIRAPDGSYLIRPWPAFASGTPRAEAGK